MSWALVFYLSTFTTSPFSANSATGGPATIAGFQTQERCVSTGERFKREVPKMDWYVCVQADVPPAATAPNLTATKPK